MVAVCEYCQSLVARTDRGLEDYGKVADLVDSKSPLSLSIEGRYKNNRFVIVGRAQVKHPAGGMWDEWYCAFDSGHWGWLSEAEGRFMMTFGMGQVNVPGFESLQVGQRIDVGESQGLVVKEKSAGTYHGAAGEMPFAMTPGVQYSFADCEGANGQVATLDYSEDVPKFFSGHEVTLKDLEITSDVAREESPIKQANIKAHALECPNCRGSLDLVAPDLAKRVVCPYCSSSLDVSQGRLSVLQTINKSNWPKPQLDLGSTIELDLATHPLRVCGFMIRSVGTPKTYSYYEWSEYLLYHPKVGFRWLVQSDGHWSFARPYSAGDVKDTGNTCRDADGLSYRRFSSGRATTRWIVGEFYWEANRGDVNNTADYVSAPYMLSRERTNTELNWTHGTYVKRNVIEKATGKSFNARPSSVPAPHQPFAQNGFFKIVPYVFLVALLAGMFCAVVTPETTVHSQNIAVTDQANPKVLFTDTFELQKNKNVRLYARAPGVSNTWVSLTGDLIHTKSGKVTEWSMPIEYYHGRDSDGSWSEGSSKSTRLLGAMEPGEYSTRITIEREKVNLSQQIEFKIEQGFVRWGFFSMIFFFILLIPLFVFLSKWSFESRKWAESDNMPVWAQRGGE